MSPVGVDVAKSAIIVDLGARDIAKGDPTGDVVVLVIEMTRVGGRDRELNDVRVPVPVLLASRMA
jgi:hypothetical protein